MCRTACRSATRTICLRGHFEQRWLRGLLGGWQTFGILTFQSGRPFTVALLPDFDNSNTGISILGFGANDRPNVVGNPHVANPTPDLWFNTNAFAIPPFGSFGNAGRNILDGPSLQTVNLSLVKNTRLREGVSLQFRAETFNFLNHPNFDLPDIFVGSPTFGQHSFGGRSAAYSVWIEAAVLRQGPRGEGAEKCLPASATSALNGCAKYRTPLATRFLFD